MTLKYLSIELTKCGVCFAAIGTVIQLVNELACTSWKLFGLSVVQLICLVLILLLLVRGPLQYPEQYKSHRLCNLWTRIAMAPFSVVLLFQTQTTLSSFIIALGLALWFISSKKTEHFEVETIRDKRTKNIRRSQGFWMRSFKSPSVKRRDSDMSFEETFFNE